MKLFFQFAALHALLMGLLPFFVPVLLWQQGYTLWQLSFFIALTGLGFLFALPLWRKLYLDNQWYWIIRVSFILEALLFASILSLPSNQDSAFSLLPVLCLVLVALLNGAYLCFYWTSQRTLFTQLDKQDDEKSTTGNNFGNFQIVVMILLKVGILISAYLLQQGQETVLMILSLTIALLAIIFLKPNLIIPIQAQKSASPLSAVDSTTDKLIDKPIDKPIDKTIDSPTRWVFFLDGPFLYLESYFWLLSLYLIAQQDVMQLGFLVIGITLLLAVLFWLIKGRIDAFPANSIFQLALVGYGFSWLLRAYVGSDLNLAASLSYPYILLIAFLTSFFRLSFNKRFFDHTHLREDNPQRMINYLLHKSILSQLGIFVFFLTLGLILLINSNLVTSINIPLSLIYGFAAPFALLYGFYAQPFSRLNKVDHHA